MSDVTIEILRAIQRDVGELKTDVKGLKTDVKGLKSDVSELKSDVSELKTDVSELKSDVSELKSDVKELKTGMALTNARLDALTEMTTARFTTIETVLMDMSARTHFGTTQVQAASTRYDRELAELRARVTKLETRDPE